MPLEASLIILDNSEYAINQDYVLTRFEAQQEAMQVLFNLKLDDHPENVVGLMTSAGGRPQVLVTSTQDIGKIVSGAHSVPLLGEANILTALELALKHRQNKNQNPRIILFVGSPLDSVSSADLVKVGKKLKKNNVAVDVILLGAGASSDAASTSTESEVGTDDEQKLRAFIESASSGDNSHLLAVPPHSGIMVSDAIRASPIAPETARTHGVPGGSGQTEGGADDFAVDPNLDPELALALRMSLEEERARQAATTSSSTAPSLPTVSETPGTSAAVSTSAEAISAEPIPTNLASGASQSQVAGAPLPAAHPAGGISPLAAPSTGPTESDAHSATTASGPPGPAGEEDATMAEDEDEELARALAMSRGEDVEMGDADDEEAEMQRAIAMSVKENDQSKGGQGKS